MNQAKTPDATCLLQVLRACASAEERSQLAARAGTSVSYLYQLAGCQRTGIKASMALAIEEWTALMHEATRGRIPKVSVRDLATMCQSCGLGV